MIFHQYCTTMCKYVNDNIYYKHLIVNIEMSRLLIFFIQFPKSQIKE